ncbi:energy transducer TonB [Sphingomonas sp.]|uniref:energy transducer TonB n=1 Tax=Sphingomonas sp. TaxID=28214 RepID=UPI002CE14361|nr:energy transducer TonB [Sphingomonas sp.]HTG39752.1 energy transducer TonB [Sphingomonas sp.]
MAYADSHNRARAPGAAAALGVTALLGWGLVAGLQFAPLTETVEALATFTVAPDAPPPPPDPVVPPPRRDTRPEGEAAPPNLTSKATEVTAPEPRVPIPLPPPPVVVARTAGPGAQSTSGAADEVGPGTGAGGIGNGFGAGGSGDGEGGGWREETPPIQVRGDIRDADYPAHLADNGIGGRVGVRYRVDPDGRARDCRVTRSSGVRELDAITCAHIERRFRFRPSRDGRGRPVAAEIVESHEWVSEPMPAS